MSDIQRGSRDEARACRRVRRACRVFEGGGGGGILVAPVVASEPVSSSSVAMVRRAPLTTQPAVPLTASLSQVKTGMVWQKVLPRLTSVKPGKTA